jgi:hypothetical protein
MSHSLSKSHRNAKLKGKEAKKRNMTSSIDQTSSILVDALPQRHHEEFSREEREFRARAAFRDSGVSEASKQWTTSQGALDEKKAARVAKNTRRELLFASFELHIDVLVRCCRIRVCVFSRL